MQIEKYSFDIVKKNISKFDYHYATQPELFREFIQFLPDIDNFERAIDNRNLYPFFRKELVECLLQQYQAAGLTPLSKVKENIQRLHDSHTFTITTAHQPTLLGGPFYFVLKIASILALSRKLQRQYAGKYHFVPVYVIGGEDHDFEEVSWVQIFNKKLQWNHPDKGGPVGRLDHQGMQKLWGEVSEILGETKVAIELQSIFQNAYQKTNTFAQATLHWVHSLFEKYGLVVANFDHSISKKIFSSAMLAEVTQRTSQETVRKTQEALSQLGFSPQAHARPINLYRITDHSRHRLIPTEDEKTLQIEKEGQISTTALVQDLLNHPQQYSPNVIMRPLLQEMILPNLAYIGGGGELAYWAERKAQFQHFQVAFPILVRRDSISWIDATLQTKIAKLGLEPLHFFQPTEEIVKTLLLKKSKIDFDSLEEIKEIQNLIDKICSKGEKIDATVASSMRAEGTRIMKSVQQLTSKLMRAEKTKNDQSIVQIENIKSKLFPEGKLQERYDSFIPLYLKTEGQIIDFLIDNLDPLAPEWKILKL
jgi:bacillithiol synthase